MILDAALIVGATLRLTRLTVTDTVTAPLRELARRIGRALAGDGGLLWVDDLVSCPHCVSVWAATLVVVTYAVWGDHVVWRVAAATLTVAYLAGHVSARLDGEEPT